MLCKRRARICATRTSIRARQPSPLDAFQLWSEDDFEEEEEQVDPVEEEIRQKEEEAAQKARTIARWEAKK